ncbi:MAG: M24 family metallopeptidase, partial [Candidatus Paceibacterota bacterium]
MALIKTKEEIEAIEEGGKILAGIMDRLKKEVIVGVSGDHLNNLAEELILKNKGIPSFKNYNGFPAALCLSLNEEIVHGIPFGKKIK